MAKPSHDHRRRPADAPRTSASAAPSAAVLSALAGIVASSPVAGSPTPPHFLCPSLAVPHSSSSIQPPSPVPALRTRSRRSGSFYGRNHTLPFRFEPGADGVWRHVETYTLYGSTICAQTCRVPTNTVNSDEVAASPNATEAIDLHDTLPAGWLPVITRSDSRTTLILALSLVLAFLICFFMIGCLLWRKTRRRKRKADEERTHKKRRSASVMPPSSPAQKEEERKAIAKQKIWAKATARWKDHVRYTARMRRGKRLSVSRSRLDSSTTLNPTPPIEAPVDDLSSTQSLTPMASRTVSRRPSSVSIRDSRRSSLHLPHGPLETSHNSSSLTLDSTPDVPSSPPAYRYGTLLTPITISPETPDERAGSAISIPSRRPSHLSFDIPSAGAKSPDQAQEPESSHVLPPHAAHVATDDKALLARLADLAERPPQEDAETSHQVSVPVWEDEQLADFTRPPGSLDVDTSGSSSQCPFPPPPSKGKMAEPSFYDYRSSFEEFSESIDPELEPSAPPFEIPSAPGLGDMVMLPSAPPLAENEFPVEAFPNAPGFESAAEDDCTQDPAAVDSERSTEHQSAASSRPPSEGTLPGYHP